MTYFICCSLFIFYLLFLLVYLFMYSILLFTHFLVYLLTCMYYGIKYILLCQEILSAMQLMGSQNLREKSS